MIATLRHRLARSIRLLLLLAAHNPGVIALPLAVVGALVATVDARFTRAALNVALVATAVLAAAVVTGNYLHRDYDRADEPCSWCWTEDEEASA